MAPAHLRRGASAKGTVPETPVHPNGALPRGATRHEAAVPLEGEGDWLVGRAVHPDGLWSGDQFVHSPAPFSGAEVA